MLLSWTNGYKGFQRFCRMQAYFKRWDYFVLQYAISCVIIKASNTFRRSIMKEKIPLISETFRLTSENSQHLDANKEQTGENKSKFINRIIKEYKERNVANESNQQ